MPRDAYSTDERSGCVWVCCLVMSSDLYKRKTFVFGEVIKELGCDQSALGPLVEERS